VTQLRKRLSDIIAAGKSSWLKGDWSKIKAAHDYGKPIPPGKYSARLLCGALDEAGTGTPTFKLTFEIKEGPHEGRRVWYDIWLSDAAQRGAVRDFNKLGIKNQEQLEQGLPPGILCEIAVAVRRDDNGTERNVVRTFEVTGVEKTEPNPFPPQEGGAAPTAENPDSEPHGPVDTSFNPAELEGAPPAPADGNGRADPTPAPTQGELPLPELPGRKRGRKGADGPYAEGR
jgi:hypothetical protein